ncbi:MAG TPA: phosphoribosyltransferase family protein [Mucilaginibacter sp.]|nr:phosphoribosyltransferase family protein [Mucilaginibacter sp.]
MKLRSAYLADFVALLFPEVCEACGITLVQGEQLICTDCRYNLPFTNFHFKPDNMVAQQFWGKINVEAAYAMCYFAKGGKMQHLMHQFKYKGRSKIGNVLGHIAAGQLTQSSFYHNLDAIIPVPLHRKRQRKRGYNQSACFAQGIAEKLNVPVIENNLVRIRATETQTHRSRFLRFENMQEVFTVLDPDALKNKSVLLVDDVITTGSTLESCGAELLKIEGLKLSIATIACAE